MSTREPTGFTVGVDLGAPGVSIGCRQRGRTDVFAVGTVGGWASSPAGIPDATAEPDAAQHQFAGLLTAVGLPSRTRCVALAHPVDWTVRRVAATVAAAQAAGAPRVVAATRPTAAAVAHEHQVGEVVVVYDLEPDRFCATVLRRRARGWETLGEPQIVPTASGHALDVAMLRMVDDRANGLLRRLCGADPWTATDVPDAVADVRDACVSARRALARRPDQPVELPTGAGGVVLVDRAAVDAALRPVFLETVGAVRRALRTASVGRNELSGVIVVGEAADDPLAAGLLGEVLACPVLVGLEPEHTVARGAARLAELVVGDPPDDRRRSGPGGPNRPPRGPAPDGAARLHVRDDEPLAGEAPAGPARRRVGRRAAAAAATVVVVAVLAAFSATGASGVVGRLGFETGADPEVHGISVTPPPVRCIRADAPAVCIDAVEVVGDEIAIRYSRSVAPHRLPVDGYPAFHLDGVVPPPDLDPSAAPPPGMRRASPDPAAEWFGGPEGAANGADPPFTVVDLGSAGRRLCVAVYDADHRLLPGSDRCQALPEPVLDALAALPD